MSDDKIIGKAYVMGTEMAEGYEPPSTSLNPAAHARAPLSDDERAQLLGRIEYLEHCYDLLLNQSEKDIKAAQKEAEQLREMLTWPICWAKHRGMLCDRKAGHDGDHVDIAGPDRDGENTWANEPAMAVSAYTAEIWVDRGRKSGQPCVYGTRLPVETLVRYADACGDDAALEAYPGATAEQLAACREFLRHWHRSAQRSAEGAPKGDDQ